MDMPAVVTTITIPGTFPNMNQIITAAKKMIIDGLVEGGILADDDWNHVCGLSDRFHVDSQNPRVVVNIRSDGEMRASEP